MSSPRAADSRPAMTSPVFTPMRRPTSPPCSAPTRAANPPKLSRIASAARTARSASSSCAWGIPKTARIASPTNFSVTPPYLSTSAFTSSKSSPWSARTSSGSGRSPRAVGPARSAKRIETTRRSSCSGTPAERRAPACSAVPQEEQNAAEADWSEPQAGHSIRSEAPQVGQKRPSTGTSEPHETQVAATARVYDPLRGSQGAVRPHLDTVLAQLLSNEELERRPGAPRHVDQAVHLPLGQELWIRAPRVRPVRHLRQPAQLACQHGPLLHGAIETLLADGNVEARLAQRVRERAEGVRVRRCRRHRAAPVGEIARARRPAELLPQRTELLEQVVAGQEPPWVQAGSALRRVPGAEVLDDRLRVDPRVGVVRELAHGRRAPEALRGRTELLQDLLVRVPAPQSGTKRSELRLVDPHAGALARPWSSHMRSQLRAF